jgi:O-6-methylguanine DNA methyltransferase
VLLPRSTVSTVTYVETRYAVPGWGIGEIWLEDGVLLAHDFRFQIGPVSDTARVGGLDTPAEDGHRVDHANESDRSIENGSDRGHAGTDLSESALDRERCLTPDVLEGRFRAFLAGEEGDFADVDLDLEWATPLQRALARTLRDVPRGEVVSYGELAALAGRPGAARAAGAFCAANRFAFVIPCHRVVAAHGLGGYGAAGLEVKRRLLALENVVL